jgi:predicted metal-dependent hydrolase
MENLDVIAVVGMAAVVVGDRILSQLKARGVDLQKLARQQEDLWNWHAREDDEGVKVWYVRRSLEDAIKELSLSIRTQTEVMAQLVGKVGTMQYEIEHLHHDE